MSMEPLRAGGDMEETIRRYKNAVYGLALSRTGSVSDAEDVFQETFLAYFRTSKRFRDEEHKKAWLLRTALNQCRRITASTWRKKTVPLESAEEQATPFREPEENRVWRALSELEETYRLPLYLHYFQEMTAEEIGKALGLRAGTVRMRLLRGREQLKERLKGEIFDEE